MVVVVVVMICGARKLVYGSFPIKLPLVNTAHAAYFCIFCSDLAFFLASGVAEVCSKNTQQNLHCFLCCVFVTDAAGCLL